MGPCRLARASGRALAPGGRRCLRVGCRGRNRRCCRERRKRRLHDLHLRARGAWRERRKGACARARVVAGVVGALTGGVEVETAAVAGFVGVDTVGTAPLPPKTPKPARIAKQRTRPDAAMMIAACVVVRLRPAMTTSRDPGAGASSSSDSAARSRTTECEARATAPRQELACRFVRLVGRRPRGGDLGSAQRLLACKGCCRRRRRERLQRRVDVCRDVGRSDSRAPRVPRRRASAPPPAVHASRRPRRARRLRSAAAGTLPAAFASMPKHR